MKKPYTIQIGGNRMGYHYFKLYRQSREQSEGLFVLRDKLDHWVYGDIFEVDSWTDKGEPVSIEMLGSIPIKRDGCSHLDVEESDDIHLCGYDGYLEYFDLITFPYIIAEMKLGTKSNDSRVGPAIELFKSRNHIKEVSADWEDDENFGAVIEDYYEYHS